MNCDRCGRTEILSYSTSYFNTQRICGECWDAERAHPRFLEARDAEMDAVKRGDFNFPGIGLPSDLVARDAT